VTSSPTRTAYCCAALFLAFGVWHAYYSLGGPMPGAGNQQAESTGAQVVLWIINAVWTLAALVPLALVQPWGRRLRRRAVLVAVAVGGALLVGYGTLTTCLSFVVVTHRVTPNDDPTLHFNYLWGLLLFGPWFVALGATLGWTALRAARVVPARQTVAHG
jgi:Protein of unknown function (DUF3995)